MSALNWKLWSWVWLGAAVVAAVMEKDRAIVMGLIILSAICMATGSIIKAIRP